MNHIYLGFTLSFICFFLAYFILSKFLLVTVFCVILAGLYFKDRDFIIFRYVATRVASFYSWISDICLNIQTMYHQSNNTNFPIRRSIENNGAMSKKFDRLRHSSSYNLSTSYVIENKSFNNSGSDIWDSGSTLPSPLNRFSNRAQPSLQEMSKLSISHKMKEEPLKTPVSYSKSFTSPSVSPVRISHPGYSRTLDLPESGSSSLPASRDHSSNIENNPLNAKLYADVSSPGFCGRIADRLNEEDMTHQSKYDGVGAFPVVNLKSQSTRIKIKPPVRVRLAPPSNELVHYNYGANSLSRSSIMSPDDSMKSVLQVLKEISRKRIHSHVDQDDEETTKRSRVTDSQLDSDGLLHTSLLQQTIQGKRVREESSPNEDDKKRRKASLQNNEIMSSLSSSISVRPPHLQTAKRKAQSIDDSLTSTPVLGKLLKVQTEVTPPTPTNHITAPDTTAAGGTATSAKTIKESAKTSPLAAIPSPIAPPAIVETAVKRSVEPRVEETEDDGAVSRLLGRMSDQTRHSRPVNIPVKKNVFMSTNDLSLSPPKENRLAAMIAVLGGPSEQSELESSQPEASNQPDRLIKGKALFTSPETPATPESAKQKKNVTFSEALTTTKIFERDELGNGSSVSNSLTLPSASLFSSGNTTPTGLKLVSQNPSAAKPFPLNLSSSPLSTDKVTTPNENTNFSNTTTSNVTAGISSPGSRNLGFQTQSPTSSAGASSSLFPGTFQVQNSNSTNLPSPGGFSFGTNSSVSTTSKEDLPKQNNSPEVKPISFGGGTKSSQPDSGLPLLFSPVTSKATQPAGSAGQNKPMFMFGNKDTSSPTNKNDNKPIVNGFAPTSSNTSSFALSQPGSQANASKLPSFTSNSNPSSTSQSASPFSFGSATAFNTSSAASLTAQQATSTTQQSNSANTSALHKNSLNSAASPSLNIFSSAIPVNTSKPNPFGSGIQGVSAFGDGTPKSVSSNSQTPQANAVFGSIPSQSSGFGSSSSLQNGSISSTSKAAQSNNIFGNVSSTTKPIAFSSQSNATPQQSTGFGFSSTPTATSNQVSSPFGIALNSSTSNTPTMFGSTTTSNAPTMFGNTTTSNTTMFGNATMSNNPTMFGNTATTNATTIFGNATTAQSTSAFGSATTSIGAQSSAFSTPSTTTAQPSSLFGNVSSNDVGKNIFAGASNSTPTFGGLGSTSSPSFGNQSNPTLSFGSQNTTAVPTFGNQNTTAASTFGNQNTTAASTFGNQNTTAASTFGNQNTTAASTFGNQNTTAASTFGNQSSPTFAFGSQNSTNGNQGGFSTSGPFGANSNGTSASEVKPPSFGSGSPFMFSSPSASKPIESVKPQGTATRFAFSASQQGSPVQTQTSVPNFGAPTPSFGTQQTPTFGAPSSQPAAPTFQFGQASSSPAPAFQFNAAPPTVGGGMFSIGSGGSSTSRPKTTALRRSHKRT